MENTIAQKEIVCLVNSICEHHWHEHARGNTINAETLLKKVRERYNHPDLKVYVDIWIASFSTRTGYYPLISKAKEKENGGRREEGSGHISYL